ncbi:MAG: acetyl-CoA carboxylase carboxyltransferase subunit alpha [bacterium]|nr:acetyl-CoA carboxylase carboxyltransferase subunit alpha [bacterium]
MAILDFEKQFVELDSAIKEMRQLATEWGDSARQELKRLKKKRQKVFYETYAKLTPWQRTLLARHPDRPYTLDYINIIFSDFIELHGDRKFGDDSAIVGGLAQLGSHKVVVIGHQKGRGTKENISRNFGMASPEGFRKALRIMKLAEKFRKPIITFIDTPGAYPGLGAEERGQAEAIARNIYEMMFLRVPIISIVTGEGGSGGALALGVADRLLMLENSVYSVISPEGCAAILWKDHTKANEAATALHMTAQDLLKLKVADEILKEPIGGAHRNPTMMAHIVRRAILRCLAQMSRLSEDKLLEDRYRRYRQYGVFRELVE